MSSTKGTNKSFNNLERRYHEGARGGIRGAVELKQLGNTEEKRLSTMKHCSHLFKANQNNERHCQKVTNTINVINNKQLFLSGFIKQKTTSLKA